LTQNEAYRLAGEVRQLRLDLFAAGLQVKLLQIRLEGAEAQAKRDATGLDARGKAEALAAQQDHAQALADAEEAEEAAEARVAKSALVVAEPFAEFVSGKPTPEEVVAAAASASAAAAHSALDHTRKAIKDLARSDSKLQTIHTVPAIPKDQSIMPAVTRLTAKGDWEQWADRMHTLATGNFALAQSNAEVQGGLEKVLLAANRQG
jgi:hypothetical protein